MGKESQDIQEQDKLLNEDANNSNKGIAQAEKKKNKENNGKNVAPKTIALPFPSEACILLGVLRTFTTMVN